MISEFEICETATVNVKTFSIFFATAAETRDVGFNKEMTTGAKSVEYSGQLDS